MKENSSLDAINDVIEHVCTQVKNVVYGQEDTTKLLSGALLIGGHVLIEGPPGIAKTLLAKTFAEVLRMRFKRIQFTPDLMPSDVTGVYIYDQSKAEFKFAPGPIFADIVLADEINRTPPKTQAALLEAMEEHAVTIDGKRHLLDELFFVIATQNPIEHEGTFPLPEAQLDRFIFKLKMSYPEKSFEDEMIQRYSSDLPKFNTELSDSNSTNVPFHNKLSSARQALRQITLDASITDYIQRIINQTRTHPDLILGASPRAGLNLALAAKFNAAMDNRMYTIPDDVKQMAHHVLGHRLIFQPEILEVEGAMDKLVTEVMENVPVPDRAMTA